MANWVPHAQCQNSLIFLDAMNMAKFMSKLPFEIEREKYENDNGEMA